MQYYVCREIGPGIPEGGLDVGNLLNTSGISLSLCRLRRSMVMIVDRYLPAKL